MTRPGVFRGRGLTCRCWSRRRLELQQQLVSDPAKVLKGAQEAVEGPRPAVRKEVQKLQTLVPVGGLRLDLLHLSLRQDVLLVQKRNDSVADQ